MLFIIQLFGLMGFLFLLFSYWRRDIQGVLLLQLFSGIFYAIHYYLLGATEGMLIVTFELFRDFTYYKTDLDQYIFIGTIPIYILFGIFTFHGFISLFPSFASIIDGFSLTFQKKGAVFGAIISEILWLIYDAYSLSYVGILTGIIMLISNFFVLFVSKDPLEKEDF